MPSDSLFVNPAGEQVRFTEEDHCYEVQGGVNDGLELTSVTHFIHNFFPVFEKEAIAKRKAQKEGRHWQDLISEWEATAAEACTLGTRVHENCEHQFLDRYDQLNVARHEKEKALMASAYLFTEDKKKRFEFVESEKVVFSTRFELAGTIDLIMKDPNTGIYWILDWKTNREIKYEGFRGERGFFPVNHLQHCNFNHYSLQLSLYEQILLEENYFPEGTRFGKCLFRVTAKEVKRIRAADLRKEAETLLDHRLNN